MSKKTEYSHCYNEDDFIERAGEMHELTVTITLCEYRNLITESTRLEAVNARLFEENTELEKKCENLTSALAVCKLPDWLKQIGRALCGEDDGDADEDESEGETSNATIN